MTKIRGKELLLRSTMLAGFALSGLGFTPAMAQDSAPVQTAPQEAEAAPSSDERIIVTGSRIRRDSFSSDVPLEVYAAADAALSGTMDIADFLQSATVAAGSPQVTAVTSAQFVQNGGLGAETVSLRGLGANRTLVLLNGRRAGPAGVRGGVSSFDLNVIPLSAIDRVEVLKDGASSIYGSDAVAGVVNIITNTDSGGTIDAFGSVPTAGAGEEYRINASYGRDYGRGHFRVTADYYRHEELAQGDRPYFQCGQAYVFGANGARADVLDPTTGSFKCQDLLWGHVWAYDYAPGFGPGTTNVDFVPTLIQFDHTGALANSALSPIGSGHANPYWMGAPAGWYGMDLTDPLALSLVDYDHPFQDQTTMVPETERITLFAEGTFDLTDDVRIYGEALLNRRENYVNGYRQYWTYIYNSNFDFYYYDVDPAAGDPLSVGWTGAQWLSPTPITDHNDSSATVDYMRFVAGIAGDNLPFLSGWAWDVSAQFSRSDAEYWSQQVMNDSIEDNWFRTGSCVGTTSSVAGRPCIDIDWLNPALMRGEVSAAERAFLFGEETGTTIYEQMSVDATVTGDLFTLPAGPVGVAFGVHYRTDEITDTPGEITLAGNAWGASSAGITAGDDSTQAIFGEAAIPILADRLFAQELTLTVSGRYTDVDSYGSGDTYKVGVNWAINDMVRLRATRGTSFRAPALFELYLADQTSFTGQRSIDPCIRWQANLAANLISQRVADNCQADGVPFDHGGSGPSATIITGGGLGVLEAETSDSLSIGVIFSPEEINFRLAIDYYEIEVNGEVDQLGASQIVGGCYASDDFANEPLCDLFNRNPAGGTLPPYLINTIRDSFININSQTNRGIDLNADYFHEFSFGDLAVNGRVAIQLEDRIDLLGGVTEDSNGEAGDPEVVGDLSFTYTRGDWNAFWGMRYVGSTSNFESYGATRGQNYLGNPVTYKLRTESVIYHNVSVGRDYNDWSMRLGVSNLFDEAPPAVTGLNIGEYSTVGTSAFYSQYDWLGRRIFANVTRTF